MQAQVELTQSAIDKAAADEEDRRAIERALEEEKRVEERL